MDFPAAIQSFTEALRLVRIVGDPVNIARFSFAIGDARLRNGDLAEATPRLLESLRVYRQKGESWGVALSLVDRARVAIARHHAEQAASMLGAASTLFEPLEAYYQNYAGEYYPPAKKGSAGLPGREGIYPLMAIGTAISAGRGQSRGRRDGLRRTGEARS